MSIDWQRDTSDRYKGQQTYFALICQWERVIIITTNCYCAQDYAAAKCWLLRTNQLRCIATCPSGVILHVDIYVSICCCTMFIKRDTCFRILQTMLCNGEGSGIRSEFIKPHRNSLISEESETHLVLQNSNILRNLSENRPKLTEIRPIRLGPNFFRNWIPKPDISTLPWLRSIN